MAVLTALYLLCVGLIARSSFLSVLHTRSARILEDARQEGADDPWRLAPAPGSLRQRQDQLLLSSHTGRGSRDRDFSQGERRFLHLRCGARLEEGGGQARGLPRTSLCSQSAGEVLPPRRGHRVHGRRERLRGEGGGGVPLRHLRQSALRVAPLSAPHRREQERPARLRGQPDGRRTDRERARPHQGESRQRRDRGRESRQQTRGGGTEVLLPEGRALQGVRLQLLREESRCPESHRVYHSFFPLLCLFETTFP